MTENRSRPRPVDFAWNDPEPVQQEPTGPALGNYPTPRSDRDLWVTHGAKMVMDKSYRDLARGGPYTSTSVDRRVAWNERLARFLNDLADRARGWH